MWLCLERGRPGTDYDKQLLLANPLLAPFD
jgi:hypothetical protein